MDRSKKHEILINDLEIQDFCQSLLWISQNFSSPYVFISTQDLDIPRINKSAGLVYNRNVPDFSLFLQTSGSSGAPKWIEKRFFQMCREGEYLAQFIEKELGLTDIKSIACVVQPHHLFGLSFGVFMPWFLQSKPQVKSIAPYIESVMTQECDVLISSPALLKKISQSGMISESFKRLKLIISAGSPLGDEIRSNLPTQAQVLDIYGSSETGVIGFNQGDGLEGFDVVKLSCNENRELIVSSPWCEEFQTSDLVTLHQNKIQLLGRSDDIVKISDKRFSLYEVENLIKQNSLILDCVVYLKKERLAVLLKLSNKGLDYFRTYGKQGVIKHIKQSLKMQDKSYLRFFRIVSEIPRNLQGKLSKMQKQQMIHTKEKIALCEVERGENHVVFEGIINEGCFCFEGHFVDFPLVPGFVQLDFVLEYAQNLGIYFWEIKKILHTKFLTFLRPKDVCRLELEKKDNVLAFRVFANHQLCLSGRAFWERSLGGI